MLKITNRSSFPCLFFKDLGIPHLLEHLKPSIILLSSLRPQIMLFSNNLFFPQEVFFMIMYLLIDRVRLAFHLSKLLFLISCPVLFQFYYTLVFLHVFRGVSWCCKRLLLACFRQMLKWGLVTCNVFAQTIISFLFPGLISSVFHFATFIVLCLFSILNFNFPIFYFFRSFF